MAKIFVSYKHRDTAIRPLNVFGTGTARDYVDRLETLLSGNHIYKGERGDEPLSSFKDEAIGSHLRDKIYDSTITIVLISKNMKEWDKGEDDQWIPWEVSYSLKEITRDGRTSRTNGMLAVVLPDENGSYQYFIEQRGCQSCGTIIWKTNTLFGILGRNMFNRKQPNQGRCANGMCGTVFHTGDDHSYIYPVTWDQFVTNINSYINLATQINSNISEYEVSKQI